MDSRLNQDMLIEDALKSQPLAEMPRSVTAHVMLRIQKDRRPAIFTWQDALSGAVLSACLVAFWFAYQNLPPIVLLKIHNQGILLYQAILVNSRSLIPALMFGIPIVLAAATIPLLLQVLTRRQK